LSWRTFNLSTQALLYATTALAHFRLEFYFLKVMPPWVPWPRWTNRAAGVIEFFLALGLLRTYTRRGALVGILLLLVIVFPVHLHMLRDKEASLGWPRWVLWIRLPLQGALMAWAVACW
jgi:uncharacterized membrane protein